MSGLPQATAASEAEFTSAKRAGGLGRAANHPQATAASVAGFTPAKRAGGLGGAAQHPAEEIGLYVHIPFCEAKCTYCHFAIDPRRPDEARQERYLAALLAEMDAAVTGRADTLYFGGGTPSLLSPDRLARLIGRARSRFTLPKDAEVTLEANPRDLDQEGYRKVRAVGVNRLSLGVQSLDDEVLRAMGRLHTAQDARLAVDAARAVGVENLSVDLILGWPGESAERWRRALDGVVSMAPDHVSVYVLEVEGKTLLAHRARRGSLELPEDDLVADLHPMTVDVLGEAGIDRYEISNFARPGRESRHNGKYWDDAPFLGFGLSAHSYRGERRWWNRDTYGAYCGAVESAGPAAAVAGDRRLSEREHIGEAAFTALRRREGIHLGRFRERYGVDPTAPYAPSLRDPFDAGLLEVVEGCLRLTERGVLLSNEVFRAFV